MDQLNALLSRSAGIADLIGHTNDSVPGSLRDASWTVRDMIVEAHGLVRDGWADRKVTEPPNSTVDANQLALQKKSTRRKLNSMEPEGQRRYKNSNQFFDSPRLG